MRLLFGLLLAGVLSLVIGFAASSIAALMPCQGEGLVCRLDEAIGLYIVLIWCVLGPLIFGVILLVARNRLTLAGGMILLLVPLAAFLLVSMIEAWQALGFEPYRNLRRVLTMFLPPALTVVAQWLVLKSVVARTPAGPASAALTDLKHHARP